MVVAGCGGGGRLVVEVVVWPSGGCGAGSGGY